jgi:lipopolysaccharide export system protein LptA
MLIFTIFLLSSTTLEAGRIEVLREGGKEIYFLREGVEIKIDGKVVKSREGWYIEKEGEALLWDSVSLKTPNYEITADSLFYWERGKRISFIGNVTVKDGKREIRTVRLDALGDTVYLSGEVILTSGNIKIFGREGIYYLSNGYGIIRDSPHASIMRSETLEVRSSEMMFHSDTFWAYEDVNFEGKNIKGAGDSLIYLENQETGLLKGKTKIFFDRGEAEADSVRWILEDGLIREVEFRGNVTLTTKSEEGVLTIKGPLLRVLTEGGSLNHLYGEDIEEGRYEEMEENGSS